MNINPTKEIGFPEFTTSLIQGVFETIQNNHLLQIKSYSELVAATSLEVEEFSADNYLDVADDLVYQFMQKEIDLSSTVPEDFTTILEWMGTDYSETATLTILDVDSYILLNEKLSFGKITATISSNSSFDDVFIAIRKKLASQNHSLLVEMVEMGMQRIVTDKIFIKTRLKFDATDRSFRNNNNSSTDYSSKGFNIGGRIGFRAKKFGLSIAGGYNSVRTTVNTSSNSSSNSNEANLNLMGYVKIEAHTDYKPLAS